MADSVQEGTKEIKRAQKLFANIEFENKSIGKVKKS